MLIPIEIVPHVNYIRRNLFGNIPLKAIADRQEVLCPEETINAPPTIFLPGQIDRITDTDTGSTIEQELSILTSEILRPPPTIAYHIKDAILVDGSIYQGRFKSFIAARSFYRSPPADPEPHRLKTVGLASSHLGSRYFGHWLIDDCTQYRLAEQYGHPLCLRGPVFPGHQKIYQSCLGQDWTPIDRAWIDDLVVYQDFYWGTPQDGLRGAQVNAMRERARAHLPSKGAQTLVYLRRGATGTYRPVQNEEELLDALSRHGFTVVNVQLKQPGADAGGPSAREGRRIVGGKPSHSLRLLNSRQQRTESTSATRSVSQLSQRLDCFRGRRVRLCGGIVRRKWIFFLALEVLQTVDLMLRQIERTTAV